MENPQELRASSAVIWIPLLGISMLLGTYYITLGTNKNEQYFVSSRSELSRRRDVRSASYRWLTDDRRKNLTQLFSKQYRNYCSDFSRNDEMADLMVSYYELLTYPTVSKKQIEMSYVLNNASPITIRLEELIGGANASEFYNQVAVLEYVLVADYIQNKMRISGFKMDTQKQIYLAYTLMQIISEMRQSRVATAPDVREKFLSLLPVCFSGEERTLASEEFVSLLNNGI